MKQLAYEMYKLDMLMSQNLLGILDMLSQPKITDEEVGQLKKYVENQIPSDPTSVVLYNNVSDQLQAEIQKQAELARQESTFKISFSANVETTIQIEQKKAQVFQQIPIEQQQYDTANLFLYCEVKQPTDPKKYPPCFGKIHSTFAWDALMEEKAALMQYFQSMQLSKQFRLIRFAADKNQNKQLKKEKMQILHRALTGKDIDAKSLEDQNMKVLEENLFHYAKTFNPLGTILILGFCGYYMMRSEPAAAMDADNPFADVVEQHVDIKIMPSIHECLQSESGLKPPESKAVMFNCQQFASHYAVLYNGGQCPLCQLGRDKTEAQFPE